MDFGRGGGREGILSFKYGLIEKSDKRKRKGVEEGGKGGLHREEIKLREKGNGRKGEGEQRIKRE